MALLFSRIFRTNAPIRRIENALKNTDLQLAGCFGTGLKNLIKLRFIKVFTVFCTWIVMILH